MGPQEVRLGPVEVRWVQIHSRRTASLVKVSDWPALASNKPPVPGNPKNITLMIVAYFIIWQCLLALLFQALCWDMAVNEVGGGLSSRSFPLSEVEGAGRKQENENIFKIIHCDAH